MQLDKSDVVDLLRKEGKDEHVQAALQGLPDKIDHEQHAAMIQEKFGIDPEQAGREGNGEGAALRPFEGLHLWRRHLRHRRTGCGRAFGDVAWRGLACAAPAVRAPAASLS